MVRQPMLVGVIAEMLAGVLLWLGTSDAGVTAAGTATGVATGIAAGMGKWALPGAIGFHLIASYFLAWSFWQLLPRRYKLPARKTLGLFFGLLVILPVTGALGVLWSIVTALKQPRRRASRDARIIRLPDLPFSPPVIYEVPPYSQGALRQIVHFAKRPLKRLKAVMATRHMAPREAMAVWSKATRDPVDDVRLLAYAMLDNGEKKLADRILALTEALPALPARRRTASHKTIAALCWELVYHRLVQGAVRQHWLETAQRHLEAALLPLTDVSGRGFASGHELSTSGDGVSCPSAGPEIPETPVGSEPADADSWVLYGRILLEADDLAQAKKAFARAREAGMSEQKIAPWLAEIAFRERKFSEVRRYLSAGGTGGTGGVRGEKGRDLALVIAWWERWHT